MTLKEAAASLGITPDSLRQAIARGALKGTKLGRDWIVTEQEVARYRAEHLRGAR
jgi:excisionase family DNA binding protein